MDRFLLPTLAYFLGVVFLVAGGSKVFTFASFVTAVRAYGIFPRDWVPFLAGILIAVEIALGVLFFLPRYQGLAGGISSVLLAGFIALAVYARILGLEVDCGCFRFMSNQAASVEHLVQNGVLLFFSAFLFIARG